MLQIRFSGMFDPASDPARTIEFILSLASIERSVAPHLPCQVIVYTLEAYRRGHAQLLAETHLPHCIVALDADYPALYADYTAFAKTIIHCTDVDRTCIVRMLFDAALLNPDAHRLLLGTDVYFLDTPVELIDFAQRPQTDCRVLYMVDRYSFGIPYRLRHYEPPILEGLVGDFYCLAPGAALTGAGITSCLKMIDQWPTDACRWIPSKDQVIHNACEQQATSILCQPFGGIALPHERYSHVTQYETMVVLHSHDLGRLLKKLPVDLLMRFQALLQKAPQKAPAA